MTFFFPNEKVSSIFIFNTETSYNGAVAAHLQLVFHPAKLLSRFYISLKTIYDLYKIVKQTRMHFSDVIGQF